MDNTDVVKKATKEAIDTALEAVGLRAERYAKLLCPVDTGLLRNSITHAVYGKDASITKYSSEQKHATTKVTRKNGTAGKPVSPVKTGSYSGPAPTSDGPAVYVGTNVEYAAYVEMGTSRTNPQPYIKPAFENNINEYKEIFMNVLKNISDL